MLQTLETIWLLLLVDPQRHSKIRRYLSGLRTRQISPALLEVSQKLARMRTVVQDIVTAQTAFNEMHFEPR